MKQLAAIDTSTWRLGVALVEGEGGDGITVAEEGLRITDSHSKHLLSILEALLAEAGWARNGIDAYVATRGPGAFTGVRVGLGTIRGLSLAANRPCFGVGTLESLAAANGPEPVDRVPLMDAGRSELYAARFDGASFPPRPLLEPWTGSANSIQSKGDGPAVFLGPGAQAHSEVLLAAGDGSMVRDSVLSVAAAAGRLALHGMENGWSPDQGMSPLYIRPPYQDLTPM
jgi:tRNA threonylcarbamoyladenosine biosynthesis protein TsaB